MAISQAEWRIINDRIEKIDVAGVEAKFDKLASALDQTVNECMKEVGKKTDEAVARCNSSVFCVELDRVLTVLEKHNVEVGHGSTCNLSDILKYVSKVCVTKEKAKGYAEYCKIREGGLTERVGRRY